jgi:hypothetical protein
MMFYFWKKKMIDERHIWVFSQSFIRILWLKEAAGIQRRFLAYIQKLHKDCKQR